MKIAIGNDHVAVEMKNQITDAVKKIRHQRLEELGKTMKDSFAESFHNTSRPVIFETVDTRNTAHGWSDNYIAVAVPAGNYPCRKIVNVIADQKNISGSLQTPDSGSML